MHIVVDLKRGNVTFIDTLMPLLLFQVYVCTM